MWMVSARAWSPQAHLWVGILKVSPREPASELSAEGRFWERVMPQASDGVSTCFLFPFPALKQILLSGLPRSGVPWNLWKQLFPLPWEVLRAPGQILVRELSRSGDSWNLQQQLFLALWEDLPTPGQILVRELFHLGELWDLRR